MQPAGAAVTDYDVQWRKAGQVPVAVWEDAGYDGTATEFTIGGVLEFDTDYEVEVRATNSDGISAWSATATGTTNRRKPGDDIVLATANSLPTGMWSDGTTLWVADTGIGAPLYRYDLDDRDVAAATFATVGSPRGNRDVWSDGTTLWVVPHGDVDLSDGLAQGDMSGCTSGGSCVLAYDMSGGRQGHWDIATSGSPQRLWSDGATLWVGSGSDELVAGYDLATGERPRARDLTVRADEDEAALIAVTGLWSDGVSMWVGLSVDTPGGSYVRVFPLDASTRTSAHDLVVAPDTTGDVDGIWSNRRTLWVSSGRATHTDGTSKVLRAYAAAGAVANSPAFFGAARFATTLDVEVAENTAGYDLRALDVERGDTLTTALSGADASLFDIDAAGVVTLKNDATFDFESPTDAGNNNVYELTATVRDSKAEDGTDDAATDQTVALTITVTDEAEGVAAVAASPSPPLVGWPVTAVLTDAMGDVATPTAWAWEVLTATDMATAAAAADADWAPATGEGATTAAYTPVDADLDRFLRVTATHNGDPVRLVTEAVTDVLVSNLVQTRDRDDPTVGIVGASGSNVIRLSQEFTTGDAEFGYVITGVDAYTDAESDDSPRVSIFSDASGVPGRRVFVLSNPASLPDPGTGDVEVLDSFAAGDQVRLFRNTKYHVVFEDLNVVTAEDHYTVTVTTSEDADGGAASGWSLGLGRAQPADRDDWTAVQQPRIGVRGRPLSDPSGSAPAVPAGLAFSEETSNSLRVSWVQPPGAAVTDYDVQWRKTMPGQGDEDGWVDAADTVASTATAFTIEGLTGGPGTDYDVRVRAGNGDGDSEWSQVFVGTTTRRKPGADIVLHADNVNPSGMSYDGTSLWVADTDDAVLYRYGSDGTQMATFATPGSTDGNLGVWSDATTVWVVPENAPALPTDIESRCSSAAGCVWAYNISTGIREPDKEVQADSTATGLWSDGATLWVANRTGVGSSAAVAYDLATGGGESAVWTSWRGRRRARHAPRWTICGPTGSACGGQSTSILSLSSSPTPRICG